MRVVQGLSAHLVLLAVFVSHSGTQAQTVCSDATTGGNAAGADCVFPFIYRGDTYTACTEVNHNQLWCATVSNYDDQSTWGNCITDCAAPSCPVPTTGGTGGGADCVFPFTFGGAQYSQCHTTGGVSNVPWCATTSNWDTDGLWGNCVIISSRNDLPCVFPFTYLGEQYYECTTAGGSEGLLWCGVVNVVVDTDASATDWGYCQLDGVCESTTSTTDAASTPTSPPTATPTTSPSCDVIATTGGTGDGANCVFPYLYRGDEYNECIDTNNGGVDWCATTYNYDTDKLWGNCDGCGTTPDTTTPTEAPTTTTTTETPTSTPSETTTETTTVTTTVTTTTVSTSTATPTSPCPGADAISTTGGTGGGENCVFPFLYREEPVSECITTNNGGVLWCGTTSDYDVDRLWGNCGEVVCISTPVSTDSTTDSSTVTSTTSATTTTTSLTTTDVTTPPSLCPIQTTGGTADGDFCVFPFMYNNELHYECITTNWNRPWCATTDDFADGQWGNCIVKTDDGATCVFPFIYEGFSYTDCTTAANQDEPWCATVDVLSSILNEDEWGACNIAVEPCPTPTTPDTTSVGVSDGGCVDTFQMVEGVLSYQGSYQSGVLTLQGCMDACLADSDCVAFDWSSEVRCFLHEDGYLQRLNDDAPNVDQYRRESCVTSSSTAGTTIPPSDGSSPACVDEFLAFEETNAFSGMRVTEATNLEECTDSCLDDPDCLAFDLTAEGTKCFLHYEGYLDRLGDSASSTQYRRVPCEASSSVTGTGLTSVCPDTFVEYSNTLALGGDRSDTAMSVDDCQDECLADSTCIAIDFNTNKNLCYLHDELSDVQTGVDSVDQYRREDCTDVTQTTLVSGGPCEDTFTMVANTLAFGGEALGTMTLDECQDFCRDEDECVAVDYNRLNMKCFWHVDGYEAELREASNIDQYIRVSCDQSSPGTGISVDTTIGGTTECVDTFEEIENTLSLNGNAEGTVDDVDACQDICLADDECQAFDFNSATSKCFTHTAGYLDRLGAASPANINQYRREFCIPPGSTVVADTSLISATQAPGGESTSPECASYLEFPNTRSPGGTELDGLDTVAECQEACTEDETCLGFDYNRNTNKCFAFYNENYLDNVVEGASAVDEYRKNLNCDAVTGSTLPSFVSSTNTPDVIPVTDTDSPDCDNFTPVEDTMSTQGVLMPPENLEDCLSLCMNTVDCEAVDFVVADDECYTHSEGYLDNVRTDITGTDQYRRNFC